MNLNDKIIVTLTPEGLQLYMGYWDNISDNAGCYPGLEGNILTIQLWDFAYIFGKTLHPAYSPPCNTNFKFADNEP